MPKKGPPKGTVNNPKGVNQYTFKGAVNRLTGNVEKYVKPAKAKQIDTRSLEDKQLELWYKANDASYRYENYLYTIPSRMEERQAKEVSKYESELKAASEKADRDLLNNRRKLAAIDEANRKAYIAARNATEAKQREWDEYNRNYVKNYINQEKDKVKAAAIKVKKKLIK